MFYEFFWLAAGGWKKQVKFKLLTAVRRSETRFFFMSIREGQQTLSCGSDDAEKLKALLMY